MSSKEELPVQAQHHLDRINTLASWQFAKIKDDYAGSQWQDDDAQIFWIAITKAVELWKLERKGTYWENQALTREQLK